MTGYTLEQISILLASFSGQSMDEGCVRIKAVQCSENDVSLLASRDSDMVFCLS